MIIVAEKFPPLLVLALATGWLALFTVARPLFAQTTVGTGGIVGTVSDPSGAVISGAKFAITNIATLQVVAALKELVAKVFSSQGIVLDKFLALATRRRRSQGLSGVTSQP